MASIVAVVDDDDDDTSSSVSDDEQEDEEQQQILVTTLRMEKLIDLIEQDKGKSSSVQLSTMTPYSDAQWLARMWPCMNRSAAASHDCLREVVHDGRSWYRWEARLLRWVNADQWMHCQVAESCTFPYRRDQLIFTDYLRHYRSLAHQGYTAGSIVNELENPRCKSVDLITLGDLVKNAEDQLLKLRRHIQRLHTLAYQRKVLAIASTVFFGVKAAKKWWGPAPNLLPLNDGTVIVRDSSGQIQRRQAEASDRLKYSTPSLAQRSFAAVKWLDCFHEDDLLLFQRMVSLSLLSGMGGTLVLWGMNADCSRELGAFFKHVLGDYCSSSSSSTTKMTRMSIDIIAASRLLLPAKKKESILKVLICESNADNKIDSPPRKSLLTANSISLIVDRHAIVLGRMQQLFYHHSSVVAVCEDSASTALTTSCCLNEDEALHWLLSISE